MSQPLMSAIICTHNRAHYLGAAIDSLRAQVYPAYEIIVVDNASTDATKAVLEARLPDDSITYVYEGSLGLSAARNRGATVARGEILAYLDDDAEADPNWLAALAAAFALYPHATIAGGHVSLIWPPGVTSPPRWLSPTLSESLGIYDLGQQIQQITDPQRTPRGLNYAIKKSFWETTGGFDLQLGRVGKNLLSNEELHMTQQALSAGFAVLFVPQAQAGHNVAPERLRPSWFLHRSWWQGISECYREHLSHTLTPDRLRVRGLCFLRGLAKALGSWRDPAQRFENLVYAYGQLGYLYSGIRHLMF
ncbi:MAG: glycosyltransferase family 2 protein [Nodosilinea sp.]